MDKSLTAIGIILAAANLAVAQAPSAAPFPPQPVSSAPFPQAPFPQAPISQAPMPAPMPSPPPASTPPPPAAKQPAVDSNTVSPGMIGNVMSLGAAPPFGRSWASVDYLLWWFKDAPVPVPLVTTSNAADGGVIGRASTQVLFGNQALDSGIQSGVQFNIGHWFDNNEFIGIEGGGFFFSTRNFTNFSAHSSSPNQLLAVPYIDPGNGAAAFILSGTNPNTNSATIGNITANSSTNLWGAELHGLLCLVRSSSFQVNFLGGVRAVSLEESLNMNYSAQLPGAGPLYNATLADQFGTRNQFYGGQLGIKGEWEQGIFYGSFVGKVAMGVDHETVNINGQFSDPNGTFFSTYGAGPGGLLAQRTNIGSSTSNPFAVVPEVQARLGINLLTNLQLFVGYDFLYISRVVRPGDQIDNVINPTQAGPSSAGGGTPAALSGAARPIALFNESSFWAQGFSLGLQFVF